MLRRNFLQFIPFVSFIPAVISDKPIEQLSEIPDKLVTPLPAVTKDHCLAEKFKRIYGWGPTARTFYDSTK